MPSSSSSELLSQQENFSLRCHLQQQDLEQQQCFVSVQHYLALYHSLFIGSLYTYLSIYSYGTYILVYRTLATQSWPNVQHSLRNPSCYSIYSRLIMRRRNLYSYIQRNQFNNLYLRSKYQIGPAKIYISLNQYSLIQLTKLGNAITVIYTIIINHLIKIFPYRKTYLCYFRWFIDFFLL